QTRAGRHGRVRRAGHELDPRSGHEPPLRARPGRSADAGPVHRDRAESRVAARVHADLAARDAGADRTAGVRVDGQDWRTAVDAHGPGARTVRALRDPEAASRARL